MQLSPTEKTFLLSIARKSIQHFFATKTELTLEHVAIPSKKLLDNGACFVSLHLNHNLRGCIGSLHANRSLVVDVIQNSLSAAFEDPRFQPLSPGELENVRISISVLTPPEHFIVKSVEELLQKLHSFKHGLILSKGAFNRATFLPVVWNELPKKEDFLSQLCIKAGLSPDEWHDVKKINFQTYEAIDFSE